MTRTLARIGMGNTANARALFERALSEVTGEASAPLWDRFLQARRPCLSQRLGTLHNNATPAAATVICTRGPCPTFASFGCRNLFAGVMLTSSAL